MSPPIDSARDDDANHGWPRFRAIAWLLLLPLELFALSFLCDLHPLRESSYFVLRAAGYATPICRILLMAMVLLAGWQRSALATAYARWKNAVLGKDAVAAKVFGHLLAAVCFGVLTARVVGGGGEQVSAVEIWLWLISGIAAIVFWLFALAPARFWRELLQSFRLGLAALCLITSTFIFWLLSLADRFWIPLNDLTLAASSRLLGLFEHNVLLDPATRTLGTAGFEVEIAPVCSGFEGIVLVTVALTMFLFMFRRELRFPRAALIVPIGIVTIWLCNVARIVVLIMIGAHWSPAVAVGGFHSQAGWIGFAGVTLLLAYAALQIPVFRRHGQRTDGGAVDSSRTQSAAWIVPFLATVAAGMIVSAFSAGFETLYPLKTIAAGVALAYYLPSYRRQQWSWSWSWSAALIGLVVLALWVALEPAAHDEASRFIERLQQMSPAARVVWLAIRALGSTLIVPVAEELAFRGYLMRRITVADFDSISYRDASWTAVLISSLLFGLLHSRWIAAALSGIGYAIAARRRNRLCDAITAHAITNGLIAAYAIGAGAWQFWV